MSTKRTPLRRVYHPSITDEMMRVWQELRAIVASGDHKTWEQQGGQKSRFYDLNSELSNTLLHRAPHEAPMRATLVYGECPTNDEGWMRWGIEQEWQKNSYRSAFELARLLDEAAAAKRRSVRPAREREPTS